MALSSFPLDELKDLEASLLNLIVEYIQIRDDSELLSCIRSTLSINQIVHFFDLHLSPMKELTGCL